MKLLKRVQRWSHCLRRHFPELSKPQAFGLAAFSLGVARAERCTLSAVASRLAGLGKADSVERRLQRWLANAHLDGPTCGTALVRWVVRQLRLPPTAPLVLLVDETSLQEHLKVMAVSLAYRGRAIPLAWRCYLATDWPLGQVELIDQLFAWIAPAIPMGRRVLVEADRGIGCSPALLERIEQRGWFYLVRVPGTVRLLLEDGREVGFGELVGRVKERWAGWVQAFKKAGWRRCWAVGLWRAGQSEPWLLLTNWPAAQGTWYGWRMWEELAFRDFKSSGWQWQRSRVYMPEHSERLWLVLALAYVWVLSLGTRVVRERPLRRQFTRGTRWRWSVFQLGLRLLRDHLELGRPLPMDLLLIPHLPVL